MNETPLVLPRSESKLLRLVDLFTRGRFQDYVVTIWPHVYVPDNVEILDDTLAHEDVHLKQQAAWPRGLRWAWFVAYLCFPVPIFFAWFRWKAEREAYLVNIKRHGFDPYSVAENLWSDYCWTWPRKWMFTWFEEHEKRKNT